MMDDEGCCSCSLFGKNTISLAALCSLSTVPYVFVCTVGVPYLLTRSTYCKLKVERVRTKY